MGEAREYVRDRLREALTDLKLADAILLTSELVANAVRHSHTDEDDGIGLEIDVRPDAVRVSVVDSGAGFDRSTVQVVDGIGGWGLTIVERLADRWGNATNSGGKHRVWFEIDR